MWLAAPTTMFRHQFESEKHMESRHKSEAGLALSPLDTIEAAARMMRDTGSHLLPVVKDGALVGVISERDIVTRFVAEGLDGWLTRVSDFMTKSPDHLQRRRRPGRGHRPDGQRRVQDHSDGGRSGAFSRNGYSRRAAPSIGRRGSHEHQGQRLLGGRSLLPRPRWPAASASPRCANPLTESGAVSGRPELVVRTANAGFAETPGPMLG